MNAAAVAFPAIDGVDTVRGLGAVGSNPLAYRRLLTAFCDQHAGDAACVADRIAAGRAAEAARTLHRLRGSALILGVVGIAERAAELERELRVTTIAPDPRIVAELSDAIAATVAAIRHALA